MAQKSYYYVGIINREEGLKFVTKANYQDRTAEWNRNEKPLAMSQSAANDILQGLIANWTAACVIKTSFELDDQCCWVQNEEKKNINKLSSLVADVLKDVDLGVANKWKDNGLTAYVNLDTNKIRVIGDSYYRPRLDKDIVQFVPSERDNDTGEVTAYTIYPCPPMWRLFKDTQENRQDFVEQLESKTGKVFAFADDKTDRVNVYARVKEQETNDDEQNEKLELTTSPKDNEEYLEEDEELDLTQGNGRSR